MTIFERFCLYASCGIIALIVTKASIGGDAMSVCQLSHSRDVCFQALNR